MPRRRTAILFAVAVLLPSAATAAAGQQPIVRGDTTFHGAGGTYADVRITEALRVFPEGFPSVTQPAVEVEFSGDGDVLAFELRRADIPTGIWGETESLRIVRYGPSGSDAFGVTLVNRQDDLSLAPGRYRAYLMSDKPMRARVRFPGAAGAAVVAGSLPFPFAGGLVPMRTRSAGLVVFGRSQDLSARGFMWLSVRPSGGGSDPPPSNLEFCMYEGDGADVARTAAYGPGCPNGRSSGAHPELQSNGADAIAIWRGYGPGSFGLGGNFAEADDGAEVFAAAGWATYVDDATIVESPEPPVPASSDRRPPAVALASQRVRTRATRAGIRLRCAHAPCEGRVRFEGHDRTGRSFAIAPGATRTIRLALPRRALRRLRRARAIRLTLVVSLGGGTSPHEVRQRVTVVAPATR